jgi:hypothetical protein
MQFDIRYLVLPLIINPNERISRILGMIEIKQNGLCVSCKERVTPNHAIVSSGDPDITIIKIVQSILILYSYLTKLSDNDFVEY